MSGSLVESLVSVALAIVGVATVAVLVSNNANTSGVVSSLSSAFTGALGTALSPVTGAGSATSTYSNLSSFPIA